MDLNLRNQVKRNRQNVYWGFDERLFLPRIADRACEFVHYLQGNDHTELGGISP